MRKLYITLKLKKILHTQRSKVLQHPSNGIKIIKTHTQYMQIF